MKNTCAIFIEWIAIGNGSAVGSNDDKAIWHELGIVTAARTRHNDCGEPLAAISVSGMTSRLTDERLPALGRIVREVADELTVALGGVMPEAKSC
jgi:hypothetical protein